MAAWKIYAIIAIYAIGWLVVWPLLVIWICKITDNEDKEAMVKIEADYQRAIAQIEQDYQEAISKL